MRRLADLVEPWQVLHHKNRLCMHMLYIVRTPTIVSSFTKVCVVHAVWVEGGSGERNLHGVGGREGEENEGKENGTEGKQYT